MYYLPQEVDLIPADLENNKLIYDLSPHHCQIKKYIYLRVACYCFFLQVKVLMILASVMTQHMMVSLFVLCWD